MQDIVWAQIQEMYSLYVLGQFGFVLQPTGFKEKQWLLCDHAFIFDKRETIIFYVTTVPTLFSQYTPDIFKTRLFTFKIRNYTSSSSYKFKVEFISNK